MERLNDATLTEREKVSQSISSGSTRDAELINREHGQNREANRTGDSGRK